MLELFPRLTPDEVARFVAYGEEARRRLRSGDEDGAEEMYRRQLSVVGVNPDPHVSLALLAAQRGREDEALEHLRRAVVRGFTDLPTIERAEVWTGMGGHPRFLALQDAAAAIVAAQDDWGGWDAVRIVRAPEDVPGVLRDHAMRRAVLAEMEPALGVRYTRLWHRLNDRWTAAALEAYVAGRPDAPDVAEALDRLIGMYAETALFRRWTRVPDDAAERLSAVAEVALARDPEEGLRPGALLCDALARYSLRDGRGKWLDGALESIRASLGEVVERHGDSPFAVPAIEGLVRTEVAAGDLDRAGEAFLGFLSAHAAETERADDLRERLGTIALRVGGLPEFRTTALDGAEVNSGDLDGKVVVVDFWATWCRPCVEQFPVLRRIEQRHGEDVVLLGVNLDDADDLAPEALARWIAEQDVPGRHLSDGRGWESDLVRLFGVREIPFSVVVGPDGRVLAIDPPGRKLDKAVRAAVRGNAG